MLTLRQYQRDAIDALYAYWQGGGGNGLIVLPTGAGKSIVLAAITGELLAEYPTLRIGCVTHVKELISQNFQELLRLWPEAPAGIFSAGIGRRDTHHRILFCGIQSVWNKVELIGGFDVLIVDEVHLISRNTDTTYGKFIDRLRSKVPDMRIVGLTATPYRLDSGRLDGGNGALFDRIVYEANVIDLIDQDYLSPLISKASMAQIDLKGIGSRGGDFIPAQLEKAAMKGDLVERAVAELVQFGQARRAWLAFCAGIDHAYAVRDAIRTHGVSCEAVDGTMAKGGRDSIIRRFRDGDIRCLTSVNVLSTGFNVPHVDLIALMRGTQSTGLYVQQVGRAFRCAPGKKNALILDFANVIRMHGPVDAVSVLPKSGRDEGKVGVDSVRAKECPECLSLAALNASMCKVCGYEWPHEGKKPRHEAQAESEVGILSTETVPPQMVPIVDWRFARHEKFGSLDSVRVTYIAGLSTFNEWLALEHGGYARQKAQQWWVQHGGATPFPRTVTEALKRAEDGELIMPATISVRPNGRFFDIVSRSFHVVKGRAA
jgi:DNA repair protein RadD